MKCTADGKMIVTPEDWREMLTAQQKRAEAARGELEKAVKEGNPGKIEQARRWLEVTEMSLSTIRKHMPAGTDPSAHTVRG